MAQAIDVSKFKIAEVRKWQLIAAFCIIVAFLVLASRAKIVIDYKWILTIALVTVAIMLAKARNQEMILRDDFTTVMRIRDEFYIKTNSLLDYTRVQKHIISPDEFLYDFWSNRLVVWYSLSKGTLAYYRKELKEVLDLIQKSKLTEALIQTGLTTSKYREKLAEQGIQPLETQVL